MAVFDTPMRITYSLASVIFGFWLLSIPRQIAYSLVGVVFGLWILSLIVQVVMISVSPMSTPLMGPPSKSLLFGLSRYIHESPDSSVLFERWAEEYGSAYRVPHSFWSSQIVLADPKAVACFFAHETTTYVRNSVTKRAVERLMGRGLIYADGESHKLQRKALNPAFNNAAIRKLIPIFYDSAYKVKVAWDALIDSTKSGEALIEVQGWMNSVSLDTIGIAGFSHDFRSLYGEYTEVQAAFESFSGKELSILDVANLLIADAFPIFDRIPTARKDSTDTLSNSLKEIGLKLLADSNIIGDQEESEDKSIIGLLMKNKDLNPDTRLVSEEMLAQMKVLLVAGYETTSISLSWALVELAQITYAQTRLREELSQFSTADPTLDQLSNSLPYLDAVVHEILRLHPPIDEITRIAAWDNSLPLSTPVQTREGKVVNSLFIAEGATITVSLKAINRSEAFWGADAKEFKPERWLNEDGLADAREIQGHRHLLTFSDGPRICLGKGFALAEFKAVLCTLIKNFHLEMQEGVKVETARGLLPRPRIAGLDGSKLPIRVRRID